MSNSADARRRWFGAFFLIVAGGLVIWGQTILKPHLGDGIGFLLYWLTCFAFTGLAILTALLDIWIIRPRARASQRELLKQTLPKIERENEESHHPQPRSNAE
ncbi:MAG: hypothetical protein FJ403_13995 [Verrucomicrobia bacterium]|nr:hypothetical protein [Verrucomicrobiota bacterium]